MKVRFMFVLSMLVVTISGTVLAEPLTSKQGDAILKELREIKQMLAKPQTRKTPAECQRH